ncbi:MAG: DUF86 domain-containing protein [Planctomycetes bacterium]|nr:DUF86 domain-containing protein [Planctomycetota bacterium]
MQRRDVVVLTKIISEIDIAFAMLNGAGLEAFLADEKLKRALSMTVINIGELVKSVAEETRLAHGDVPWKAIAGMRDIAAHKYQTLRMEDVYNTVTMDFPSLRERLNAIVAGVA